ncbi:hypothetical protein HYPSUDRAFT_65638 [Hypholoma sublateritium FD-334 SS-4]|uniref:WSC domain-containing protein n=1 Tax=Hypholoma sublateritium (strain FD-334 SS-4) TaxID=945553 RepID=A0A0D2P6V8_HYPSF|nr:hypothetical protein HYPSUDRAFT_65638 [Hypholoma sublateritium FD-334 SS-4]
MSTRVSTASHPVGLTIESCVAFCNEQSQRLAGLEGDQCKCANIYRPDGGGFESDPGECHLPDFDVPCPGNAEESCGLPNGTPSLISLYLKTGTPIDCSDLVWPGGSAMTAGKWRFSYFYNDSTTARALSVNAATLAAPVTAGSMSSAACTTACGNAGYTLAGVEFGDECFCGNALENNAHTITDCALLNQPFNPNPARVSLTVCTGNPQEICGGPGVISIFTLPGTGLIPLLPFVPSLDNFCAGENCMTET